MAIKRLLILTMPLLYSILMLLGFVAVAVGFYELVEHSPPVVLTVIGIVFLSLWGIGAIIMLKKWLYNWVNELKERKKEERIVGCKLTKSELAMLKDAKKRDSHFTDEYVREFGEYKNLAKRIREQTREELYRQGEQ